MDILIKAAQLILALIILVTVHEFGHYIFARIFGVKVTDSTSFSTHISPCCATTR